MGFYSEILALKQTKLCQSVFPDCRRKSLAYGAVRCVCTLRLLTGGFREDHMWAVQ